MNLIRVMMKLDDIDSIEKQNRKDALESTVLELQRRYGGGVIKTGNEIIAEKRFEKE